MWKSHSLTVECGTRMLKASLKMLQKVLAICTLELFESHSRMIQKNIVYIDEEALSQLMCVFSLLDCSVSGARALEGVEGHFPR